MFVGILVALYAVIEVADALLDVLAANVVLGMFMATVAGISAVVVADMAGRALNVVVAIQFEILRVVECSGSPFVLAVALTAIAGDLLVQAVLGRLMATLTFVTRRLFQQPMIELPGRAETFHPGVVAMAGDTVRADEFLMERCRSHGFQDWQTCGGELPDLLGFVAADAAF